MEGKNDGTEDGQVSGVRNASFLDLPPEVRMMIYRYHFNPIDDVIRVKDPSPVTLHFSILASCKTIHEEAKELAFSTSTFHISLPTSRSHPSYGFPYSALSEKFNLADTKLMSLVTRLSFSESTMYKLFSKNCQGWCKLNHITWRLSLTLPNVERIALMGDLDEDLSTAMFHLCLSFEKLKVIAAINTSEEENESFAQKIAEWVWGTDRMHKKTLRDPPEARVAVLAMFYKSGLCCAVTRKSSEDNDIFPKYRHVNVLITKDRQSAKEGMEIEWENECPWALGLEHVLEHEGTRSYIRQ